jgi:hypothetical protein
MTQPSQQSPDEYIEALPEDRKAAISAVRSVILANLPAGYEETVQHGMLSYVIPLAAYPVTYNKMPLLFAGLASQKNYMTVHLMNIYGNPADEEWFVQRYTATGKKLNMGKSCVLFKTIDDLLIDLIGEAVARTPVESCIQLYESARKRN